MSAQAALSIVGATRDYAVSFHGQRRILRALRGIDLEVGQGEVVAIVGESGCGKTTLSRLMLGIEPPTSGTVAVAGKPIASYHRIERAGLIQPVFQDPYSSLNPRQTLGSIIAAPLAVRGDGNARSRQAAVAEMMQAVGLPPHLLNAYPSQISGGQRQRVAIARALIAQPRILICDEPTSALDVSVQSQIINLIGALQKKLGLTVLLISHNLAVVYHMAERVAVMYLGTVVETGPTEELFARPRHPYTRSLLDAVLPPTPGQRPSWSEVIAEPPNPVEPPPGCPFNPRCSRASDICRTQMPEQTAVAGGMFRCHHPLDAAA
ncbi:oligopeptide/dipeptide ABC transporter ATP-binding protein [Bosea robiniae]|uniref:Peptide/nickel transport system ATP-binding protein n=1 Tax=Bosea robiniae TaxID=1036780 RepID=A0ABY0P079_9HYPH|nr:oligopeptide/dipeptide ABC transporter ATP-binding protein [Bosea robiniae]SDG51925.1 peptide/nickel transport system ATP-binding protein [Bosea robiniae]